MVALHGATGKVAWHFQTVHHNVFDFDLPAQPMLIDWPVNGGTVPALVQHTKQGLIFVFNRATGEQVITNSSATWPWCMEHLFDGVENLFVLSQRNGLNELRIGHGISLLSWTVRRVRRYMHHNQREVEVRPIRNHVRSHDQSNGG